MHCVKWKKDDAIIKWLNNFRHLAVIFKVHKHLLFIYNLSSNHSNHEALDNFYFIVFMHVLVSLYFVLGMHFSLLWALPALRTLRVNKAIIKICHPNIKIGGVHMSNHGLKGLHSQRLKRFPQSTIKSLSSFLTMHLPTFHASVITCWCMDRSVV